ncbi:MAG TPA: PaaI family thioesterase, partial [Actinomycetota bacterium]|nr:PaaI family thioesterase [Actinomycetota bacterium]
MSHSQFTPGERFATMIDWAPSEADGIWWHLGWKRVLLEPGFVKLEWEPSSNHSFPAGGGWIVHGGMVTALLDTAMGSATWTLLNDHEVFLTADLRTEFYRPTVPGRVTAEGRVIHKTRRVTFASAELFDAKGKLLASCRGTNLTIDVTSPEDQSKKGPTSPSRG